MTRKNVCFRFEKCLETNVRMQKVCKTMLADGFRVYILTNLPEEEFYPKVRDFAMDHHIYYKNIIFNSFTPIAEVIAQYQLRAYFSANPFEVNSLNARVTNPVGYYIPG